MSLAADDLVADRYRVVSLRGRGGTAEVHVARDERLGRDVALKVLTGELVSDEDAVERLRREASTIAALNHPNVVTLHDILDRDGDVVLVLELVDGPSLAARLAEEGPLPVADAVTMAREVAAGLAAAHERGLVHRDVTPGNVLFAATGEAKVADFGIARAVEGAATTEVLGTVHHVAPERIRGGPPDRRSDLYGLGSVLFQALVGEPPFTGDNPAAVLSGHLDAERPHPRDRRPEVPPALDALVVALLAVAPEDRPAAAADVVAALEDPRMLDRSAPPDAHATTPMPGPAAATAAGVGAGAADAGPDDPTTAMPTPTMPAPPLAGRRGRVLALVVGVVLLAVLALALGATRGADGPDGDDPAATATPTSVPSPTATTEPPATPTAEPSPSPTPAPAPTTPEDAVARLRTSLVEGRRAGLVSEDGREDVEDRIGDLVRTLSDLPDEPPGKQAQEADKAIADVRKVVEEAVDDGDLDPRLAALLDDQLADLAALYGVDGQRGKDDDDD